MKRKVIQIGNVKLGDRQPLVLIAGPCVIESRRQTVGLAERLVQLCAAAGIPLIFKASYDKANRTAATSFRGPGLTDGLAVLREIKERWGVPILTDVHTVEETEVAAAVVDVLQLPAFLCRQTDLVTALGESGRVVNIKKGQFLAPWDVRHIIDKVERTGNRSICLTERGCSFGYNNLVADMRSLLVMREYGYPVIFDATHSVQLPGAGASGTAGDGRWAPHLARAAVATGCDAIFLETHVNPARALSDKDNAIRFSALPKLIEQLQQIDAIVNGYEHGTV
jgi:2-dehydro-3-deoxyphosphooctonate aldolase (KDO 8-P synthase)